MTAPLNHPGGNTGFRIEHAGRSFAYCSDYEPDGGSSDEMLQTFVENADLAFLDSTYTPEELPEYRDLAMPTVSRAATSQGARGLARSAFFTTHTKDKMPIFERWRRRQLRYCPAMPYVRASK